MNHDRKTTTKEPGIEAQSRAASRKAIEQTVFPIGKDGVTNDQFAFVADTGSRRSIIIEASHPRQETQGWFGGWFPILKAS